MKKLSLPMRFALAFIINALPLVFNILFYKAGGMYSLYMLLPSLVLLTVFNYYCFDKLWHFLLVQLTLFVCVFPCELYATRLYYNNISSDRLTLIAGEVLGLIACGIILVATAVGAVAKKLLK